MVFGIGKAKHPEITAEALHGLLARGEALVIDVREPDEFAQGHIPGALNMPLSTFDPASLPDDDGCRLVLNCLGGKRSAMALDRCGIAQQAVDTHLAGGFNAWQAARLPIEQ